MIRDLWVGDKTLERVGKFIVFCPSSAAAIVVDRPYRALSRLLVELGLAQVEATRVSEAAHCRINDLAGGQRFAHVGATGNDDGVPGPWLAIVSGTVEAVKPSKEYVFLFGVGRVPNFVEKFLEPGESAVFGRRLDQLTVRGIERGPCGFLNNFAAVVDIRESADDATVFSNLE